MNSHLHPARLLIASLILFASAAMLPAPTPSPTPAGQELAVIVHPDNTLASLTSRELKKYLELSHRYWPDKHRVVLFQRPASTPLQTELLKSTYKRSEKSLRKHFVSLMNSGKITALPSVVKKSNSLIRLIAKKRGAVAVILASEATELVKVVPIDGKKPGQKGYSLRLPSGGDSL